MTTTELHTQLLRPAVLQILRAAGFSYTRPVVLDTLTDLAARYLLLLASSTAQNAFNNHNTYTPTLQDVRLALLEAGALRPQLSAMEEHLKGTELVHGEVVPFEDMRGVDAFINWAQGPANKEIHRIAGYSLSDGDVAAAAVPGLEDHEDYVTGVQNSNSNSKCYDCGGTNLVFQQLKRSKVRQARTHVTRALF